jgi:hypothetical protein
MAGRVAYYGNIVKDGLVLDLDAAKRDSYPTTGTVWRDISGNQYTGSLTNGPTFSSTNYGSIGFDGVDDNVVLGNVLNIGTNSITLSAWVKLNTGSGTMGIIGKTSQRSYVGRYAIYIETSNINALFQPVSNYTIATSVTPYVDGKFHNICLTINRTGFMTLYIDSTSVGTPVDVSSTSGVNLNASTDYFYIGAYGNSTGQTPALFLNGNIAQTTVYNRALSSAEVLQNYNATKQRYGL